MVDEAVKLHNAGTGETGNQGVQTVWAFYCPGCKRGHAFHVPFWSFNGDIEKPTFTPSLMCNQGTDQQCHLNLIDGQLHFAADSHHELAGKTVEMEDWDVS